MANAIVTRASRSPFRAQLGAQHRPSRQLADLLADVRAWARHQDLPDLVQAMTEAQAIAGRIGAEVRHG